MHIDATLRAIGPRPQNIPIDIETVDLSAMKPSRPTIEIDYSAMEVHAMQLAASVVLRDHARNGRRRSRQCRGSRARNFTRAQARTTSAWAEAAVTIDAVRSGAYAAAKGVV